MTFRAAAGLRLDHFLQQQFPETSRSRLQQWIKAGRVWVNGAPAKAGSILREGDEIAAEPAPAPPLHAEPEEIPLDLLYADADLVAVNKPAGMVVHAGAGVRSATLVNALLHHFGQLSTAGGTDRPGIVHRLDKETSGVILVARNDRAHQALAAQFADRSVRKVYLALVHGAVRGEQGRIDTPVARDPVRRVRMTTRLGSGRTALSEYRVVRRLPHHTLLEVRIGTGRTHQIRVHLASIGHPVAGDRLYGAPAGAPFPRFFLHAASIGFAHPASGEWMEIEAPLPGELEQWLACL